MPRDTRPRYLVHVGPGHATHASMDGETTLCGRGGGERAETRTNSHMPYRREEVDCKRCITRLP